MSPEAGLTRLNALPADVAREALLRCCGAPRWAEAMVEARPYRAPTSLFEAADRTWSGLAPADRRLAFAQHPRIGDRAALGARFAATRNWSGTEQAGVALAEDGVLDALAAGNQAYEARFGHVFLVCATGKTAEEMLGLLRERLRNDPERELQVAAAEQAKITRLRLDRLLEELSR